MAAERISPQQLLQNSGLEGDAAREGMLEVDEAAWVDVIQKMDEVYTRLIDDEVELEKKNAELEQSQQFVFSVISAMSDVLVVCDAQGLIEQTNDAFNELVGRPGVDLRGTPVMEWLADAVSVQRLQDVLGGVSVQRRAQALELYFWDGARQAVPVDAHCTPRLESGGRPLGMVLVGRPMAEIKQAYQELRTAHEALQRTQRQLIHSEKMASLGRLVAGVAHELNNPISFVLGNVHALERYLKRFHTYLEAMHTGASMAQLDSLRAQLRIDHLLGDLPSLIEGTLEGAQRTADIVHGLKRFSAVDTDVRAPVEVGEVVERALHWIRKGVGAPLEVQWSHREVCTVQGSAGQLQQVVMNLLQNALDAMALRSDVAPLLELGLQACGEKALLTLADNGGGIAAEDMHRIFDPFFTTKPVGKGTGLGLSISYGIVEQHGGRLSVRNLEAGGAEFTVELPLAFKVEG